MVHFNSISRIIIFYPHLRKFIIFPASSFIGCRDTLNKWSVRMVDKVAGFYLINNPFVYTTRKLLKNIRALYYKPETARLF